MLTVEHIVARLAASGLGIAGKDLFAYHMPETIKQGLVVTSRLEGEEIDEGMGSYRRGTFQIVARSPSFPTSAQLVRRAATAVALRGWQTLPAAGAAPATAVLFIRAQAEPILFPVSDGDLVEASVDFEFACA